MEKGVVGRTVWKGSVRSHGAKMDKRDAKMVEEQVFKETGIRIQIKSQEEGFFRNFYEMVTDSYGVLEKEAVDRAQDLIAKMHKLAR